MPARPGCAIRRLAFAALVCAAVLVNTSAARAASTSLYRIFLLDGTTLTSYGEFARVADRVVFSMPIGSPGVAPDLQLVTIAQASVDWDRTDRYSESVRARRYAETRGEEDFALLTGRVVEALNQLALVKDPAERLAMAEEARRNLAQWPAQNYGYRARDVAQLSGSLDEVVSELRVAAGQSSFDLSLVANTTPPPPVELLPDPDFRESTEEAFAAARFTSEPTERISLLRAIVEALADPAADGGWAAALYARATTELTAELRTDKAYADLASTSIVAARAGAARGDVRGLQGIIERALTADDTLGTPACRPDVRAPDVSRPAPRRGAADAARARSLGGPARGLSHLPARALPGAGRVPAHPPLADGHSRTGGSAAA